MLYIGSSGSSGAKINKSPKEPCMTRGASRAKWLLRRHSGKVVLAPRGRAGWERENATTMHVSWALVPGSCWLWFGVLVLAAGTASRVLLC